MARLWAAVAATFMRVFFKAMFDLQLTYGQMAPVFAGIHCTFESIDPLAAVFFVALVRQ